MDVLKYALEYIERGWRVLPVSSGKHAGSVLGKNWQTKSSTDVEQIKQWFSGTGYACAVHLGPISGIVDIEADCEAGNKYAGEMIGHIVTPTFVSSRSTHRIFEWDNRLSGLDRIKYKIKEVEYRVGRNDSDGNPMGCISVFPPTEARQWVQPLVECVPAKLPQFIVDKLIEESNKKSRPIQTTPYDCQINGSDDIPKRASAYVDKIPRTQCGTESCHNRTYQVACHLIVDFGLSVDAARPILQWWIGQGEHDWSDGEIEHKLNQAIANPEQRGRLLSGRTTIAIRNDVDLSGIMFQGSEYNHEACDEDDEKSKQDNSVLVFPEICLSAPGVIGEIIKHNLSTSIYPQPELAIAGALALMGTVTGRKVRNERDLRTNIYTLCLGESTIGKNYAREINQQLLIECGLHDLLGPEDFGSGAGLISQLHLQPAMLAQLDEIGYLFEAGNNPRTQHKKDVITNITKLFTSANGWWQGTGYADPKKRIPINQPHLCICGTATPAQVWNSLTRNNVSDGFVGRFLFFEGKACMDSDNEPCRFPKSLVETIRDWGNFSPGGNLNAEHPQPITALYTDEAKHRMKSHMRIVREKMLTKESSDSIRRSIWGRCNEKAAKLALLFACSRQNPRFVEMEIDIDDVELGIALANYTTRRMCRAVDEDLSDNDHERKYKGILKVIKENKKISQKNLLLKTRRLVNSARERDEILKEMIECSDIIITKRGHTTWIVHAKFCDSQNGQLHPRDSLF